MSRINARSASPKICQSMLVRTRTRALLVLFIAMLLVVLPTTIVLWILFVGFGGVAGVLRPVPALHPLIPLGMAVAFIVPPVVAVGLVVACSARELRETLVTAGVIAWIVCVILPLVLFLTLLTVQQSVRWSL